MTRASVRNNIYIRIITVIVVCRFCIDHLVSVWLLNILSFACGQMMRLANKRNSLHAAPVLMSRRVQSGSRITRTHIMLHCIPWTQDKEPSNMNMGENNLKFLIFWLCQELKESQYLSVQHKLVKSSQFSTF